ncbi:MAG: DUF6033 family protein [Campylobacter sp.]|nr:DUF6033 family protein [Campylobacter sp.]
MFGLITITKIKSKYEALIYDINELAKNDSGYTPTGDKIIASGYTINADGTAGMWTISQSTGGKEEKSYIQRLLDELNEKAKLRKEEQKRLENLSEKTNIDELTTKSLKRTLDINV